VSRYRNRTVGTASHRTNRSRIIRRRWRITSSPVRPSPTTTTGNSTPSPVRSGGAMPSAPMRPVSTTAWRACVCPIDRAGAAARGPAIRGVTRLGRGVLNPLSPRPGAGLSGVPMGTAAGASRPPFPGGVCGTVRTSCVRATGWVNTPAAGSTAGRRVSTGAVGVADTRGPAGRSAGGSAGSGSGRAPAAARAYRVGAWVSRCTISRHDVHRSDGSFSSARPITGRSCSGRADRSGGSRRCCRSSCLVFAPLNGRVPVSSSWYTMPRLYWSLNRLTSPWNVSGAAYTGVTPPVTAATDPSNALARPKSATLMWSNIRNRFCGLTSRCCSLYRSFIRSSASAVSPMYRSSSSRPMPGWPSMRHSRNRSHRLRSASSITTISWPSMTSYRSSVRMYGWRMSFIRPSDLSSCSAPRPSSVCRSPYTNLTAFWNPPGASHFHTSPNPPRPSRSIRVYPSSGSGSLRFGAGWNGMTGGFPRGGAVVGTGSGLVVS
jgi:hypothetical protein